MEKLLFAKGDLPVGLLSQMANRHGLIAGATGTGKTITLQVIAEQFSRIGVPVFLADVKGDLSGISQPGSENPKIKSRLEQIGLTSHGYESFPVTFWDLFGEKGHPVRTTISEMGPLLLSRLMDLNETQSGVLSLVFKVADDQGLLLLDMKDLRAMLQHVAENSKEYTTEYGNINSTTIGSIQRGLLVLEEQGAGRFFGEPAMDIMDFMVKDSSGKGMINILAADKLMNSPKLYSTFLLWLLAELFSTLPEAGDLDRPKLVFFFDEAHLLFDEAPKALLEKIEQVVRLIRSKGVGVYFVTQNPIDIPEDVLGQLGNRVQHALRAFTPKDQKAVKAASDTFRINPKFKVQDVITELGVGEALVSCLDEKGSPGIVERALIYPPGSKIGPITEEDRRKMIDSSKQKGKYEKLVDRDSAYEMLKKKHEETDENKPFKTNQEPVKQKPVKTQSSKTTETIVKTIGKTLTSRLARDIFGMILKGGRR